MGTKPNPFKGYGNPDVCAGQVMEAHKMARQYLRGSVGGRSAALRRCDQLIQEVQGPLCRKLVTEICYGRTWGGAP